MYFTDFFGIIFVACVYGQSQENKKCYFAKTCIHDGEEKCGQNEDGNFRRFIDSCDLKEYNCLHRTDYRKTNLDNCKSLPPLESEPLGHTEHPSVEKSQGLHQSSYEKEEIDLDQHSNKEESTVSVTENASAEKNQGTHELPVNEKQESLDLDQQTNEKENTLSITENPSEERNEDLNEPLSKEKEGYPSEQPLHEQEIDLSTTEAAPDEKQESQHHNDHNSDIAENGNEPSANITHESADNN